MPGIAAGSFHNSNIILADNDWQKVLVGTGVGSSDKSLIQEKIRLQFKRLSLKQQSLVNMFCSGYLQLQQSGQDISTDTVNSLVSSALNNPSIVPTAKVYAFSDIKIGKDDSITAAIMYGKNISLFFENNNAVGNEAMYARDAEEQNDPTISAKIDPIITAYQNILSGLLATIAPPSLAKIHLDLINAMSERLIDMTKLLRVGNTDPAAGLEGAGQYLNGLQDLNNAFGALKNILIL